MWLSSTGINSTRSRKEKVTLRMAGVASATETSSILDRHVLTNLEATTRAAEIAYWRAGIARPRELEGLAVEVHDAFNSLLPIGLADLGRRRPTSPTALFGRGLDHETVGEVVPPVTVPMK